MFIHSTCNEEKEIGSSANCDESGECGEVESGECGEVESGEYGEVESGEYGEVEGGEYGEVEVKALLVVVGKAH